MAKRDIRKKQANRLRKAFRNELPAYIDLVQWLKDRRYADTTGQAEKIILAGRVRSNFSNKLGITQATVPVRQTAAEALAGKPIEYKTQDVVQRYVSASVRGTITVLPA